MLLTGLRDLPGFVESLRTLMEVEQYALQDIADMFGVSRQRITQLCDLEGIPRPIRGRRGMFGTRVWCDELHRFLPVPFEVSPTVTAVPTEADPDDPYNWKPWIPPFHKVPR